MSSSSRAQLLQILERQELLEILHSLGVLLPMTTKLPLDALQERLTKSLDRSQRHSELFSNKKPKIKNLQPWKSDGTLKDAMAYYTANKVSRGAYKEVRAMLSESIGMAYESGIGSVFVSEDSKGNRIVKLKITGVYRVTEKIPLVAVEYCLGRIADDDEEGIKILNSPSGHTMFRKILELNAARFKGSKSSTKGMIPSYLLPLDSLNTKDIGSLCKDVGCIVCGKPSKSRCSRCQSVSYCGSDCQREDWRRHKPSCFELGTGTWIAIKYITGYSLSWRDIVNMSTPQFMDAEPTIHGEDPFLVKVLVATGSETALVVHDRQQSFKGTFLREFETEKYKRLEEVVHSGCQGQSVYLWAKYIGNKTLSICIDRKPDQSLLVW